MEELGVLHKFYTSSYVNSFLLKKISESRFGSFFKRRYNPNLSSSKVVANWCFEVPEIIQRKLKGRNNKSDEFVFKRDVKYDHYMANKLGSEKFNLFWGFQGSCLLSIEKANELGKYTVCELATAHVGAAQKILGDEMLLQPKWANTINNLHFPASYVDRLNKEVGLADKIVAASEFTRQSLLQEGIDKEKIVKISLGVEISQVGYKKKAFKDYSSRPLKVLFSGAVTQRKGFSYIIEAFKNLNPKDIQLHIIGAITGEDNPILEEMDWVHYHGAVSQSEMFALYHNFDILLLPSLFEGFGLVIVEAMAAGLPVIASDHSMAPDIINQFENGVLIPIRNASAIQTSVEYFRNRTSEEMINHSENARKSALEFSWKNHKRHLNDFLKELPLKS